jgi:uncharacterized membrane protein
MMKNFFIEQISLVQGSPIQLNWIAAIMCYIILVCGLYYFIIRDKRSIFDAFILGILVYGVYETTNMAIIKQWKYQTVIVDMLWGGILFATTTYLFYMITSTKNKNDN